MRLIFIINLRTEPRASSSGNENTGVTVAGSGVHREDGGGIPRVVGSGVYPGVYTQHIPGGV